MDQRGHNPLKKGVVAEGGRQWPPWGNQERVASIIAQQLGYAFVVKPSWHGSLT